MTRRTVKAREAIVTTLRLAGDWVYVLDLMRASRLHSGRLCLAVESLEADGFVESTWDDGPWPRRRLYRLTRPEEKW